MGQYFTGVIVKDNKTSIIAWVEPNGWRKLTEHSYIENDYVRTFEKLIYQNPQRVVWSGDYADPLQGSKTNLTDRCEKKHLDKKIAVDDNFLGLQKTRYILNISKKMFVDKYKVKRGSWDLRFHPLPFLICDSNGKGGGDYFGADPNNIVGSWCKDYVSVQGTKPKGFTELIFDLDLPY